MTEPRIDALLLAAVLDGTATTEERERILRLIAGSKDAYAEFSEVVAIHGLLHGAATADDDTGDTTVAAGDRDVSAVAQAALRRRKDS